VILHLKLKAGHRLFHCVMYLAPGDCR
jgi:hypothetical protein